MKVFHSDKLGSDFNDLHSKNMKLKSITFSVFNPDISSNDSRDKH